MTSSTPANAPLAFDRPVANATSQKMAGKLMIAAGSIIFVATLAFQILYASGVIESGFDTWLPVLYAYALWAASIIFGQVLVRGERGSRATFVLPAVFFTVALVVFPTIFGFYIAFTSWNLSSDAGRVFNGWDNLRALWNDPFFWNALGNMLYYGLMVLVEYAVAFGLAMILNSEIRARRFFRIVFLLPFMLSPVAVSWMVGKSIMENRFGPMARLARLLGWERPAFFSDPWIARLSIEVMDAWVFIPLMIILLLAGLQALPKEVLEASKVDGATPWQAFWRIIFPLMLPVSITTIIIRIIFKLKLADIVINVTAGGPGGATDTVSSFIYREYRDRSNVGYGTALAEFYLIAIIIFITVLLIAGRRLARRYGALPAVAES
ncbi:MAG: sugar ABC transporter permease [Bauldia sp.]|uniref:carbohydrate ABC transporter permease n=1 Tax=Bauldia sp. TaxID=2575872 RepID=UPI001DC379CB|nr:sugar ABC transporter permease [Bauldia sp.]MCB1496245.1 sugar ABC transporter permease [Bauldia sp.]